MKSLTAFALVASLLAFSFASSGCIGSRTKKAAQFPAAELAWPGVEDDYLRGLDDGLSDGVIKPPDAENLRALGDKLGAAIDARDTDELRLVPWGTAMRPWADRGIQDKLDDSEVGPTVAAELSERVVNFTLTIESLQRIYR